MATTSEAARRRAFTNGVKPMHAVVLVVFLLIRYTYGGVDLRARRSASEHTDQHDLTDHDGPALHAAAGDEGHEEGHHGYQVFHVEFERVELPFIIALWIFVSSLAKIGECHSNFISLKTLKKDGAAPVE